MLIKNETERPCNGPTTCIKGFLLRRGYLLGSGRSSANANQEEWLRGMHLDKEGRNR